MPTVLTMIADCYHSYRHNDGPNAVYYGTEHGCELPAENLEYIRQHGAIPAGLDPSPKD